MQWEDSDPLPLFINGHERTCVQVRLIRSEGLNQA